MNAILLKIMALRSEFFYSWVHKKTPCARKLQKSGKGDKSRTKRLPIPLSCWTKTVLSSSNFSPRKSVFRVRLTGNKTKQEMKTGNSSLLCSHNRDKFQYINGRSVSQFWVCSVFSDKNERKLQESQLIQMVFTNDVACFWQRAKFVSGL